MSYKNRSKEYDWFKGQKNQKGKDPKQAFKTTWRFTKIFLMFSLFFFSMWGCVQVFVIKTDTKVGNGVEFYGSEEEISPHATEFKVETDSTTHEVTNIYATNANIWINEHENPVELKEAQKVLTSEGTTLNAHKMSDAMKGLNEYFRVVVDKDANAFEPDKIVAISSEQATYSGAYDQNTMNVFSGDLEYKIDISSLTGAALARAKYGLAAIEKLNQATKSTSLPNGIFKQDLRAVTTTSSKDQIALKTLQVKAFGELGKYIHIANSFVHYKGTFAGAMPVAGKVNDDFYYNTTTHKWNKLTSGAWVEQASQPAPAALKLSGPSITGTKYRPIVTWAQAWERGVGPFYGLFVYPISQMGVAITKGMGMHHGWESLFAIVVIVFILRILAFGLTFKSVMQQAKQQEMQAKKAIIDAKYEAYKGNKQMEARKKQETADLYKKEGISPLGALGTIFITMPIFLSIWRVIGGVPHLKATVWLGINFSATSYKELFAGEWQYLPLLIVAALSAAASQLYPRLLTKRRDKNRINVHQKAAMKKNNKTQNIILVVYIIMSVIFSAGIQIYWIIGGVWQIIQTTITHHILVNTKKRNKKRVKV